MRFLTSLRKRRNNQNSVENEAESETRVIIENGEEQRVIERERRAPIDDVCPICFGAFVFPCRGPCAHWYCGGCILMYWNYGSAVQPCKCPMCSQQITRLIPEASMNCPEDDDTMEKIRKYNYLFAGGFHGMLRRVVQLPLVVKRFFGMAMDPDADFNIYYKMRYIAILLGVLYCSCPLEFLPRVWPLTSPRTFDLFAMLLFFVLRVAGYICRWQRQRRQGRQLLG